MSTIDPIEHISAYCDRWCERCAFTSRCSLYAVEIATGMCDGDYRAGLELVLGVPCRPGQSKREPIRDLPNEQPTEAEMAETTRESDALDDRLDELPISTLAWKVMLLGRRWLDSYGERWCASAPILGEAMQIASWDCCFITPKLRRALSGRDEFLHGNEFDDDPVQNDWNGSAKVALISIVRSAEAWEVIAGISGDPEAAQIAQELRSLREEVERVFPDAWRFVRPGFDTLRERGSC